MEAILAERKKAIAILENKTKGLDFFTKNRMIYIFQKNIVKNKRIDLAYFKWFDVANISRNPNNTEEDFSKYKDDKDMAEVINRIRKDKLPPDEFKYVSDLYMYDIHMARMEEDFKEKMARREAYQKKRISKIVEQQIKAVEQLKQEKQKVEQEKQKVEQEKQKVEQEKQKAEQEKDKADVSQIRLLKSIKMLLLQGETIESIAESLDISIEETTELVQHIQNL